MNSRAETAHRDALAFKNIELCDEYRLLLACARTRVAPPQQKQIRHLCQSPLDWPFILGKAYWHSLTPLLYRNLNAYSPELVPAPILQQLQSHYLASAKRNLVLSGELIRVLHLLESSNIVAVPYKGPALAALVYGDIALRKFCDLDLIISPQEIDNAKATLIAHGYQWRPFGGQEIGANEVKNHRLWHEYNFVHPDNNATLDLHWSLSKYRFPVNIDLDSLWPQLERAQLLKRDIRVFPAEILLLFLCIHGCKDLWWKRLGWICDIAELLSAHPEIDWTGVQRLATRTGTRRMLALGLTLARELLQASLPESVTRSISADKEARRLAKQVYHRLFDRQTALDSFLEKSRFHIRVRERLREKIPACQHMVGAAFAWFFIPGKEERDRFKLDGTQSALYYLARPASLASRLWTRTVERYNRST